MLNLPQSAQWAEVVLPNWLVYSYFDAGSRSLVILRQGKSSIAMSAIARFI